MSCEGLYIGLSLGAHLCCDNDVDDMGLSQYGVVKMAIKVPQFFVHEGAPKASGFISERVRDTKFHPLTAMEHGDYSKYFVATRTLYKISLVGRAVNVVIMRKPQGIGSQAEDAFLFRVVFENDS